MHHHPPNQNRSPLRQEKFKEFFNVEIHKILSPGQTRWLSLKACVDRILEQYVALIAYFRENLFEDPSKTVDDMLTTMENKFTEAYLEFMKYALELAVDFNTLFQSEIPLLHRLKPEVKQEVIHLDAKNYDEIENIYIGVEASETMAMLKNEAPEADIKYFFCSCQKFYIEIVTQIKKRFKFDDPLFNIVSIVDPEEAQSMRMKSLLPVFQQFPVLKDHVHIQQVDNEWKQHALLDHVELGLDPSMNASNYWNKVFDLKNAAGNYLFENLKVVIKLLLVLPFSNASVERIFSSLRLCKTDHRNSLENDTIVALLATKQGVQNRGGRVKFEPTKDMLQAAVWKYC